MKKEIDIAFELLRAALENNGGQTTLNSQFLTLNSHDWWSLFRLLQRNHVAALCFEAAAATDIPREVKIPWLAEADKAEEWHRFQHEVQDEIVEVMAKRGIETLVLKGTHVAQYYPRPELREFGDLDLYFYDKHDEADRVAREVLKVDVSNDAHHHTKYNYRGVTVESHYDFVNTHYPPSNRRYEALLKELVGNNCLTDSKSQSLKDSKTQGLKDSTAQDQLSTFEILFLLRHMACHFASSRITLRDLVDWTLTCRALQDKVDWPLVEKTVSDYGMTEFVSALNTIAQQRLGAQILCHPATKSPSHPDSMSRGMPSALPTSLDVSMSQKLERDIVYGSPETDDKNADGLGRLTWKMRRWNALAWKRKMVYSDSPATLWFANLTSHAEKPRSILHKQ